MKTYEDRIKDNPTFKLDDGLAVIEFVRWAVKIRDELPETENENIKLNDIWLDALEFLESGQSDFEDWFLDNRR